MVEIRPLRDGDWDAVWPFFDAIVQAGESYAYPLDLTPETALALWRPAPPGEAVVAVVDGRVVGTAHWGPNRPGRGSHVATGSFMVDPASAGHGVGRALGEHVVAAARSAGYRGIQFNAVVETNTVAVRLWQSLGFEIVGTVPGAFRSTTHGYVGLHVMYLPLH
jgi:GNAT superfamily N-acetyltransferase